MISTFIVLVLISISCSGFYLDLVADGGFSLVADSGLIFLFCQFLFWFDDGEIGKTVIVPQVAMVILSLELEEEEYV